MHSTKIGRFLAAVSILSLAVVLTRTSSSVGAAGLAQGHPDSSGPEVSAAVYSDVSGPLSDLVGLAPAAPTDKEKKEKPLRVLPNMGNALNQQDGAVQSSPGPLASTTGGLNFAGVGQGDYGFSDLYAVHCSGKYAACISCTFSCRIEP